MTSPRGISAAAQASHSVCNRSIPLDLRKRTRIASAPANRLARIPSEKGTQIPVPTSDSPTALPASGLCTPGFSSNGPLSIASPMKPTKLTTAAPATHRQRRESRRPSGKM